MGETGPGERHRSSGCTFREVSFAGYVPGPIADFTSRGGCAKVSGGRTRVTRNGEFAMTSPQSETPPISEPDSSADAAAKPADAASLGLVILRDVAILAGALSLFAAADAWYILTGTALASILSLVDGLLVGLALGALLHEWGHFAGARLTGGTAPLRPLKGFLPLFDFDYANNTSSHFQGMSIGGNAAHWAVFFVLFFGLPLVTPGQVAIASGAFGFAIFASSIEFPVIRNVSQGLNGLEALSKIPKNFVTRNGTYGVVAALIALVVL